jgi:ribosomal protein L16 Arg81 hydroxylase
LEARLDDILDKLLEYESSETQPTFYVGSTGVDTWLPGFRENNDIGLHAYKPLTSIWIGNRSRVAAHFDYPDNIACCVLGRRRFTLFPPDQLKNLYIGPMDLTPAGQQISLVDFEQPDLDRFPKFAEAVAAAAVADLEPGDALFLPGMWWHHVEAMDTLNVLVNYWWNPAPDNLGSAADALTHALMAIKDLSPEQRAAWRELFDYYVFDQPAHGLDHIPEQARGRLGTIDATTARRLRAELLNKLRQ